MENKKKLHKSQNDKKLFGVCGGLAEYFNINSILIRLIFCIVFFMYGGGLLLYIILAFIMPNGKNKQ